MTSTGDDDLLAADSSGSVSATIVGRVNARGRIRTIIAGGGLDLHRVNVAVDRRRCWAKVTTRSRSVRDYERSSNVASLLWRFRFAALLFVLLASSCALSDDSGAVSPADRAMNVEVSGCGLAPDTSGSGVAIGSGEVLTVAHTVARAETVTIVTPGGDHLEGSILAIDLQRDLALVGVDGLHYERLAMADAMADSTGEMVGGLASGTVVYRIDEVVDIRIEEVLGSNRSLRRGYRLVADASDGDSGVGLYDGTDTLVGILFAVAQDGPVAWATAASEFEALMELPRREAGLLCDPDRSRIVVP